MPMLPKPTTSTRFAISLSTNSDHIACARRLFCGERRFQCSRGVPGPADLRLLVLERARREIRELLLERAAARTLEGRPIGRVRAVQLVVVDDSQVGESVLNMDQ